MRAFVTVWALAARTTWTDVSAVLLESRTAAISTSAPKNGALSFCVYSTALVSSLFITRRFFEMQMYKAGALVTCECKKEKCEKEK